MAVFTQLNEVQVAHMLQGYELGELSKLTPIQSGTENTNYFIEVQKQGHSVEYLLTIFERLHARDLPFYLDFTAYLAKNGVLVPSPIEKSKKIEQADIIKYKNFKDVKDIKDVESIEDDKDEKNKCIYLNQNIKSSIPAYKNSQPKYINKPWAVVEKLAGQSVMQPHVIHIAQVAQNLAKMHCASQYYLPRQENMRGMSWWHATIPLIYPHLDTKKSSLLAHEFNMQQTFYQSNLYNQLPKSIAHCDLFRDNVMFKALDLSDSEGLMSFKNFEPYYKDLDLNRSIQLSGFFDFYFAAYETMLFDFCITVNDWCMTVDNQLDPVLTGVFFSEYQKVRNLTNAEEEALPMMYRAAALRFWVSRLFDWYMPREASFFKPHPPERFEMILRYHLEK